MRCYDKPLLHPGPRALDNQAGWNHAIAMANCYSTRPDLMGPAGWNEYGLARQQVGLKQHDAYTTRAAAAAPSTRGRTGQ